jgi:hypothetical protein
MGSQRCDHDKQKDLDGKIWTTRLGPLRQIAEQISALTLIPDIIWTH